jgi:peptidase M28-like protein/phosphodiester glycosidase
MFTANSFQGCFSVAFTRALLVLALAAGANVLGAQPADSSRAETVAPGVTHTRLVRLSGPFVINILAIDLRNPAYTLRHVRALDQLRGREQTSAMVARLEARGEAVIAALNADFFDLKTGENENNTVIDGEWWKGVALTDSRADSTGHIHSQFALDDSGHPLIDQFAFDGIAFTSRDTFSVTALNAVPRTPNSVAFFSARYAGPLESDSIRTNFRIQLVAAGRRADTLLYLRGVPSPDGAALVGYESFALRVGSIRAGETLKVVPRATPRTPELAQLAGGWPRIVRDGGNVAARAQELEGSLYTNIGVRNPRTAIGFSRDSTTLWLVTVDGRSNMSAGMTGVELGDFMRELGAYQALNLDGGGSTTMVVRDRIVNTPSDSAGERAVGDALVLVARRAQAPSPVPALDSARLMADISALAADSMEGRRIGTPGGARARAFLIGALKRVGIAPAGSQFEVPFTATTRAAELNGVNLAGIIRGTKHADRYIVVSAHYDHLGVRNGVIYNGADDNASGTAAVLAMAQWFKAHPPENSIIFALFDGEESGLLGAKAFLEHPPVPVERIIANVNLDMVSRNVKGELYASGATPYPVMKPLLDSIAAIAPVKLLLGHDTGVGENNWIQQSDQGPFATKKIPFVYFGVEDHPDYHKPGDKVGHIEPGFYYHCVQTIAEFVRRLDFGLDRVAAVR